MIIILTSMHHDANILTIQDIIKPFVDNCHVLNISIVAKKNIDTHEFQYHGLVEILPDTIAEDAIKKIDSIPIKTHFAAIREYKIRVHNEPKIDNPQNDEFSNNLQNDRRLTAQGHEFRFLEKTYSIPIF